VKPSAGAKSLVDAINMLVVCLCYLNVVLPGCAAQSLGLKLTADAAQLKNAQKGKRTCTNVALQLLCHGVTTGNWTQSGTEANKNRGHVREVLVLAVRLLPIFMFAFDGATTLALAGVSRRRGGTQSWLHDRPALAASLAAQILVQY